MIDPTPFTESLPSGQHELPRIGDGIAYDLLQPAPTQWVAVGVIGAAGSRRMLVGTGRSPEAAVRALAGRLDPMSPYEEK